MSINGWTAYRRSTGNSWADRTIFSGGRYCHVKGCLEDALVEVPVILVGNVVYPEPIPGAVGRILPACWNHGPGKYGKGREIEGWAYPVGVP